MSSNPLRVYVHTPRWFIRPRNTDWVYTRRTICRLTEFVPWISFRTARSFRTLLEANLYHVERSIRHRLGRATRETPGTAIDRREFSESGCDIVFCHDDFPRAAAGLPVVWQNAVLDPAMLSAGSMTDQQFDRLVALKRTGFEQSAVVQLATEAERARHARDFPDLADRFHAVPFFVPDAAAIPLDVLERKLDCSETLKCLFVGHEARRKGLDRVFQALLRLGAEARKRVQLTVVSKLTDGHIAIQPPPGVRMLPTMPHWQVMQLMRDSDVFVMPSRFESYGLVFLEAMSQGTIPVVPDWEVQRELVDQGAAGVVTSGSAEHLASVLSQLMGDRDLRRRLSLAAHSRFVKEFEPRVVAQRFASCMSRARP